MIHPEASLLGLKRRLRPGSLIKISSAVVFDSGGGFLPHFCAVASGEVLPLNVTASLTVFIIQLQASSSLTKHPIICFI